MNNNNIIVFFIADIIGQPGFNITAKLLPGLVKKHNVDLVIANGENGFNGRGMTEKLAAEYHAIGIDVITSGNHIFDNYKVYPVFKNDENLLRPMNYPRGVAGRGFTVFTIKSGAKVGVLNLQGRTFMQTIDCPFQTGQYWCEKIRTETPVIITDFHAEASAEKQAMGWFLDGKVSAVIGTHTHVQTADERILPGGTAFITDVGMTGPFDSVIGMSKEVSIKRFTLQTPFKYEIASDNIRLNAALLEINPADGKAVKIERIALP
ncbi:TIGR00282 family metallophosphoesterase [bacterium]|nr:TIGR00282 family metallophosphoesterase [FCB group bacterium]MBL7190217.1 TIGR00282 family metallophosphoesterase [bacterium]